MKKTISAFVLFFMPLVTCGGTNAQVPGFKTPAATSASDFAKLNIEKILQQLQTIKAQPNNEETWPLQVVVQFLNGSGLPV